MSLVHLTTEAKGDFEMKWRVVCLVPYYMQIFIGILYVF